MSTHQRTGPEDPSPAADQVISGMLADIFAEAAKRPRNCSRCGVALDAPGVCTTCGEILAAEARRAGIGDEIRRELAPRFRWARWDSPELPARVAGGAATVARARAALRQARVVLLGGAGTGKTTLASAWLREQLEAQAQAGDARAKFVPARDLLVDEAPEGRALPVARATYARRLVLDDLGAELEGAPVGGGLLAQRAQAASRVIALRHDRDLPIVVTTALDRPAIASAYGDGIARRVFEGAAILRLGGTS